MIQAQQPNKTKDMILDTAEALILTRGYNGFSYKDIAERVGIRKASIHYHFPSKEDLGAAFVAGYLRHFELWEEHVADLSVGAKLNAMYEMFETVSDNAEKICPLGMLTAEYPTLPTSIQQNLHALFNAMDRWITAVLKKGQAQGYVNKKPPPEVMAKVILNALSGSMKMARVFQDVKQLEKVFKALKIMIGLTEKPKFDR